MLRSFGRHVRRQFVGYLALFIALGGVSYAAIVLPINSVGSKQIKRGAVKKSDLGRSAVTTGKVKNGSLLSIDFKPGQLLKGDKGDPGTNGTNGTPGANGIDGQDGRSFNQAPLPSGAVLSGMGLINEYGVPADDPIFGVSQIPVPVGSQTDVKAAPSTKVRDEDESTLCTGTYTQPTAPAGRICVYSGFALNVQDNSVFVTLAGNGRGVQARPLTLSAGPIRFDFTWAYRAP